MQNKTKFTTHWVNLITWGMTVSYLIYERTLCGLNIMGREKGQDKNTSEKNKRAVKQSVLDDQPRETSPLLTVHRAPCYRTRTTSSGRNDDPNFLTMSKTFRRYETWLGHERSGTASVSVATSVESAHFCGRDGDTNRDTKRWRTHCQRMPSRRRDIWGA